jgi:DNA polymerase III subunit epsilon
LQTFETLVDPERAIPAASQEIHKISAEMLQGKPKIADILPHILELTGTHIIVGHGINFDISLIEQEAKRANIPTTIGSRLYLDTLRMARLYGQSPTNSLEQLRKHFNIKPEGAHRAMSDVLVNIEVFKHLAHPFRSSAHIIETLKTPIKMKIMPLGKHKGRPFGEIPLEYLLRSAKKSFDQDLAFSIRSEIRQRRQGGGFKQAANPFSAL